MTGTTVMSEEDFAIECVAVAMEDLGYCAEDIATYRHEPDDGDIGLATHVAREMLRKSTASEQASMALAIELAEWIEDNYATYESHESFRVKAYSNALSFLTKVRSAA